MLITLSNLEYSWQIDGETVERVADFIFLGSKITADGNCKHEIKRRLLLGRKVMTNLDSIFKSRDITLPAKVHLVKVMVFPVAMYGCESWTIKKAEKTEREIKETIPFTIAMKKIKYLGIYLLKETKDLQIQCNPYHALNMPGNLGNSTVPTGVPKVSFHSNPKERQCQRMFKLPHNCTHLTR